MNFKFVYKICTKSELQKAKEKKEFQGSKKDLEDGYIHFSGEDQVEGTLKKFYSNQKNFCTFEKDLSFFCPHNCLLCRAGIMSQSGCDSAANFGV